MTRAMDWPEAALAALVDGELVAPWRAIAAPWLALAARAGPTPRAGPLCHDWLLPGRRRQLGLNVFCHDDALVDDFARAVERTAQLLGGEAPGAARALLAHPARWNGGFAIVDGAPRLKLYASDGLEALTAALALSPGALAIGVDVTAGGAERARSYRPASADPCWAPAEAWLALNVEGISHHLLASLDGRDWKRSFDLIFGPEASLDGLHAAARRIATLDPTLVSCLEPARLGRLAAVADRHGLVLRPVAYEVDVFSEGRRSTDALVTLAAT